MYNGSPNLQHPFEIEIYASDYAMRAFFMQGRRPICYHYEKFSGFVTNYPTYDKE